MDIDFISNAPTVRNIKVIDINRKNTEIENEKEFIKAKQKKAANTEV